MSNATEPCPPCPGCSGETYIVRQFFNFEPDADKGRTNRHTEYRCRRCPVWFDRKDEYTPPAPPLTFDRLRAANVKRCESAFHAIDSWSPSDWACALAGEVGEACNFVKKLRRLAPTPERLPAHDVDLLADFRDRIAKELADVVAYADLLAARLDIDLGRAVAEKFNEVSDRVGSDVRL